VFKSRDVSDSDDVPTPWPREVPPLSWHKSRACVNHASSEGVDYPPPSPPPPPPPPPQKMGKPSPGRAKWIERAERQVIIKTTMELVATPSAAAQGAPFVRLPELTSYLWTADIKRLSGLVS